ncbi:hypothetical protein SADUNF_Sadunf16G0006700 [Salix dunnii]|uniref:Uncharacterized protein n=1 Tax=Salix dunnii TaxID=1413687 RepID=A0A835MFM9_9ROSI|nr:hypothetical protein SADUNF_Sadunf16G0006700 [Salix dunnii]
MLFLSWLNTRNFSPEVGQRKIFLDQCKRNRMFIRIKRIPKVMQALMIMERPRTGPLIAFASSRRKYKQKELDVQTRRKNYCIPLMVADTLEMHGLSAVVKNNTEPTKLQEGSVHPEFAKDKLVLSWIKATSSSSIKTLLIPCTTAHQAWIMLVKRLSPLASTRVRILRDQIRTLRKDSNTTIADYLNYAKSLLDSLIQSGATMDDDEFISYILDGLALEYKELATTLHLHPDIDFDQFYDLALREEHLQKRMSLTLTTGVAMAADQVPNEHSFNSRLPSPNYNPNHRFGRGRGRNWNQGHGSGRGPRRTGQWEPTQGAWTPDRHSQPRDPRSAIIPSTVILSDGRPPLLPTPSGRAPNSQHEQGT